MFPHFPGHPIAGVPFAFPFPPPIPLPPPPAHMPWPGLPMPPPPPFFVPPPAFPPAANFLPYLTQPSTPTHAESVKTAPRDAWMESFLAKHITPRANDTTYTKDGLLAELRAIREQIATLRAALQDSASTEPQAVNEMKAKLRTLMQTLESHRQHYQKIRQRMLKTARNKRWKRRRRDKLRQEARNNERQRELLLEILADQQAQLAAAQLQRRLEAAQREHDEKLRTQIKQLKAKVANTRLLCERLNTLRQLRGQRLLLQPEHASDTELYATVMQSFQHEQQAVEQAEADAKAAQVAEEEARVPTTQRELFEWYNRANTTLERLIERRREWDRYIVPAGTPDASRIPPHFVYPPKPSSYAWGLFLRDSASKPPQAATRTQ